jgi:hypothetical protein
VGRRASARLAALAASLTFAFVAAANADCAADGRCGALPTKLRPPAHGSQRRVRSHVSGRIISPVLAPPPPPSPRPIERPTFTERPVLPGNTPVPAFLPNNLPPVFAPQPVH